MEFSRTNRLEMIYVFSSHDGRSRDRRHGVHTAKLPGVAGDKVVQLSLFEHPWESTSQEFCLTPPGPTKRLYIEDNNQSQLPAVQINLRGYYIPDNSLLSSIF
jgi:hypothetical protein